MLLLFVICDAGPPVSSPHPITLAAPRTRFTPFALARPSSGGRTDLSFLADVEPARSGDYQWVRGRGGSLPLRNQLYVACVMGWPMQPARLGIFLLVLLPLCHTGRQSALQIVDHVDCRFLRKALVNVKVIPLRDSSR
jgi:hypothetical protein